MDQLKLVLEHKFWILAGVALLLPPIGWYAATENLATETATRSKKIDDCEKRVRDDLKEAPNEKWIAGAQEIDRELTKSLTQSQEQLFEHQKAAMTLPPVVQQALDKCHVTFDHDGGMSNDFLNARQFFVELYDKDWKETVKIVKPFNMTTGEGLVLMPNPEATEGGITKHYEVNGWRQSLGFTGKELWEVQEDIWFLRSLMQAIARVNEGTTELGNSRIKKIIEATLRGGDAADLKARQSGTVGAKPGAAPVAAANTNMRLGGGPGSGTGSESTYKAPKSFDADDIFGDDGSKGNETENRHDRIGGAMAPVVRRWVDQTPKWKTRGFVLRLVMDEREIPTLLTSLTQSPFPVEILHVEHSAHTGGAGADLSFATSMPTQGTNPAMNAEPVEVSPEQLALQKKVHDTLATAFNVHYLADVIVAGKFTIYFEATKAASKTAVAAAPSASNQAASVRPAATSVTGNKQPVSTGASGRFAAATSAKSVATPAKSAAARSSSAKGAPGAVAPPAKAAPAASSSTSGIKTNPAPTKSGTSGK